MCGTDGDQWCAAGNLGLALCPENLADRWGEVRCLHAPWGCSWIHYHTTHLNLDQIPEASKSSWGINCPWKCVPQLSSGYKYLWGDTLTRKWHLKTPGGSCATVYSYFRDKNTQLVEHTCLWCDVLLTSSNDAYSSCLWLRLHPPGAPQKWRRR